MKQNNHYIISTYREYNLDMIRSLILFFFMTSFFLFFRLYCYYYSPKDWERFLFLLPVYVVAWVGSIIGFFRSLYLKRTRKNHIFLDLGRDGLIINPELYTGNRAVYYRWDEVDYIRIEFASFHLFFHVKPVKKRWIKYEIRYGTTQISFYFFTYKAIRKFSGRKDIIKKRIWEK